MQRQGMNAQDIERYLAALGQELQDMGVRQEVRILIVGDAFMLTQIRNRPTTGDIDVLLKDIDDPLTSPLYQPFKTAVRAVATRNQIPSNWINDVIGDALRDNGTVPEGNLWRKYGMFEIYVPSSEYILALKLLAGRSKDREDIQILCQQLKIRTSEQAQHLVDRYIPDKQLQQANDLDDTLDEMFP